MYWKNKALIQNVVSRLPEGLSTLLYYPLQRRFGGLRNINPIKRLKAGIAIWDRILSAGREPVGSTFFEVGTGRMLNVPTAYWLMGAEKTTTVDLNRYLKQELVRESLDYIRNNRDEVRQLFGTRLIPERLDQLCAFAQSRPKLDNVLSELKIEYRSPADAADTNLPKDCIDFHTSYTVLEHIPPEILAEILREAKRITSPHGLVLHGIDYTDHFSHSDSSITSINFLQFNQEDWDRLAGNRYMYMNRLRHTSYLSLFQESGLEVISHKAQVDPTLVKQITNNEICLAAEYRDHTAEDLAASFAWILAESNIELAKCG